MTGFPDHNFPAFHEAAAAWRAQGWEVFNPAESFGGRADLPYRYYVEHDLGELRQCQAIALLPWWCSPGARGSVWEYEVARTVLGLRVYDATLPVPPDNPLSPETILQEAQRLVHGPRGADYGHPADDYARTGRMWGAILGIPDIDPRVCCLMMVAVKVSREANKHKRDNLTDMAGYAECANMIAERQAP